MNDTTNAYFQIMCSYCDDNHYVEKCPRVEEIEYYPGGAVKRVKFKTETPKVIVSPWKDNIIITYPVPLEKVPESTNIPVGPDTAYTVGHECGKDCILNTW